MPVNSNSVSTDNIQEHSFIETNENVNKLLDWILSEEGQYIIEETGYVGIVSEFEE